MRFLDHIWYQAMQLLGCEREYAVDRRVESDPEGLKAEILPEHYVLAFRRLLVDRDGEYDPPTDADVRRSLERYVEARMDHARRVFLDIVQTIGHPFLFACGYVTQEQYDSICEVSRYWGSIYDQRVRLDEEMTDECVRMMGRRMRYFGMHDATVSVTRLGRDIRMECRRGLSIPELIVLEDAVVVQGVLPDRFGGLYNELYRIGDRYEVGFLGETEGGEIEFTITAADVRMFNNAGVEITDDYHHDEFYERHSLTHRGTTPIWERDPDNRTYRRIGPVTLGSVKLFRSGS